MKGRLSLCLLLIFAALGVKAELGREVRVRLAKEKAAIKVSGLGLQISAPSVWMDVKVRLGLQRALITQRRPGQWRVQWNRDKTVQVIHSEHLWVRGDFLRLGVVPIPYNIEVHKNLKQGLDVLARLDLETYLLGVLPAEMPVAWPLESLKAQVVAARSYVLSQMNERKGKTFDVESTIIDQVYKFLQPTTQSVSVQDKIQRAVEATKDEVLLNQSRLVLKAFYSADCGCESEDPKHVWGVVESFASIKDPTCERRPPTLWKMDLPRAEVVQQLTRAFNLPSAGLRSLQVSGRTPSGRVAHLLATLEVQGEVQRLSLSAQEFRRIFGFTRVRSSDFSLHWWGQQLTISGQGAGHGVGLCQMGARDLAKRGLNYREILKTYYPMAILSSLR